MKRILRLAYVVLVVAVASAACARATRTAPKEVVLEIFNAQNQPMSVAFTLGGTVTQLGTISARDTRRWAIPGQTGTHIRLVATDAAGKQSIVKELDLDQGQVVRWEIRP